jgi:hypothetical protein
MITVTHQVMNTRHNDTVLTAGNTGALSEVEALRLVLKIQPVLFLA